MQTTGTGSVREEHAAKMRGIVEGFGASGLTQGAYCLAKGISRWQLRHWRERSTKRRFPSSFVELDVIHDDAATEEIELRLPGGAIAVVRGGTSPELIRSVLRAAQPC